MPRIRYLQTPKSPRHRFKWSKEMQIVFLECCKRVLISQKNLIPSNILADMQKLIPNGIELTHDVISSHLQHLKKTSPDFNTFVESFSFIDIFEEPLYEHQLKFFDTVPFVPFCSNLIKNLNF